MGKFGKDHGSEYHFRWFRKNRAAELDAKILAALQLPTASLSWIYPNENKDRKEPRGMSFLRDQPERNLVFWKWKSTSRHFTPRRNTLPWSDPD